MHSSPSAQGIKKSLQNRQDETIHPLKVKDDDFPRLINSERVSSVGGDGQAENSIKSHWHN